MDYIGKVYRPPSEAKSFILQCTVGCAENTCRFCPMYKADQFRIRPQQEILAALQDAGSLYSFYKRVFLADGDALVIPTDRLLEILQECERVFPNLERVTAYSTVHDILRKSPEELKELREAGLEMLYLGLESGSDKILQLMDKRQNQEEYIEACLKAKEAGLKLSITMILGLGQKELSEEHIRESAKAISATKPEYTAFLNLQISPEAPLYQDIQEGKFIPLGDDEVMEELRQFIEEVDSEGTVFRANHASNPVPIRGTLNKDKQVMLNQIEAAVNAQDYRPESWRNL